MAVYHRYLIKLMTLLLTTTVEESPCSINRDNYGNLIADCKSRSLTEFPTDLDPSIQALDISKNKINELKPGFSKMYRRLENFTMTSKDFNEGPPYQFVKIDKDTFADLKNLKLLDISKNIFETGTKFVFPPNIEILALRGTYQNSSTLDISYLKMLKLLELNENELTQFPVIYKRAPLWYCDIRRNPLVMIPAEQIAQYCNLRFFYFSVNENILKDCSCWRIRSWMEAHNMEGVSPQSLNCNPTEECKRPYITLKMEKLYKNCLENRGHFFEDYGLYFAFLVSMLLSIIIIGLGFWFYKTRRQSDTNTVNRNVEPNISEESAEEEGEEEIGMKDVISVFFTNP